MQLLNKFFLDNLPYILILFAIWMVALSFFVLKSAGRSNWFKKNSKGKDLEEVLGVFSKKIGNSDVRLEKIEHAIEDIYKKEKTNLQKVALLRFNPFSDAGGDQSFAIAFLDENNDGVVISNLHSRDYSKVYAKPIKAGEAVKYPFSKEEEEVIKLAIKNGKN